MAISAKSAKSARKRISAIKKKPASAKNTVKVQRQAKTTIKIKPAKALPKDWPVTSKPPTLSATDSALRPGSLLQEKCNGQDIHLNRQALMAPSIAKEKGRYLLILPGTFSFKSLKEVKSSSSSATNKEDADEDDSGKVASSSIADSKKNNSQEDDEDDDDDDDEEEEDEDVGQGASTSAKTTTGATTKPTLPQFGNVEGLSTPTPKLRISFPNSDKSLVFPGTKVDTSSKYMWLNCSMKKKGTVACKVCTGANITFLCLWIAFSQADVAAVV
jgi:hypothetical protein